MGPSTDARPPKLFVCYVPTLDRRWVEAGRAPYVRSLLEANPWVRLRSIPTTELVPTIITGTWPHQNRVWQVSLKDDEDQGILPRLGDRLPDWLTTTVQCVRHLFDPSADLPGVPYRRRRRFNLHRMKYTRRSGDPAVLQRPGGQPSIFEVLGSQSRHHFTKSLHDLVRLRAALPTGEIALEFLELYALDLFAHWNYKNGEAIGKALRQVDDFIARVHEACLARGVMLMLVVDHGQAPVHGHIDLRARLRATGVPASEYTYLIEVASARFWFETERARHVITRMLRGLEHVTVLSRQDMFAYGVRFEDPAFGELYAITDHGTIYFPHDFHQPLANAYVALTHAGQLGRLGSPLHQGYHGHLPDHPAEQGYCLLVDPSVEAAVPLDREARLIDIAPTILTLLDRPIPASMSGRTLFHRSPVPAEV